MQDYGLDDLFREFGNDKPYHGSFAWKAEIESNKQARQIFQDFAGRVKNGEDWNENDTRAQLAALGYNFEPWHAPGWHG